MPNTPQSNRANQNFLALDLELNQPSGRLIQVGVCVGNRLQSEEEYLCHQWLVDPEEPIAPAITALTGITDPDIQEKAVSHETLAWELSQLTEVHACFVNPVTWGGGDSATLKQEFAARAIPFPHFGRRWVDVKTCHVLRSLALGRSPAGGLSSVMGQYKLPFVGKAHRADVDALNTLRLFFHLLERQSTLEAMASLAKAV